MFVLQVFFYQNFRLRTETYDRDISLIQYCASKMDPNEFLIHVLNKFDLIVWFSSLQYTTNVYENTPDSSAILADDFFSLLLALVSERHVPGVGDVSLFIVCSRAIFIKKTLELKMLTYLCS